jgi:3-deoxy-D-manno-octulosonate 8-phosphate phosphatase (KDO 8-P phosphatase)
MAGAGDRDAVARERARCVALMVFDVDGVLTDGRLYIGAQGEVMKAFDVRDGHGIKLLREAGIQIALLTARRSEIVGTRARELGIARVLQGQSNKLSGFESLMAETGVPAERCGYVGDDWPDLPVLDFVGKRSGFAATVADACAEARAIAHWVAPAPGGRGAVRQLAEFILRAQDKFDDLLLKHTEGTLHA